MGIYNFLSFFSIITSCSGSWLGFNENPDLDPRSYNLDWMKSIPEETPLSAISIPGTHESLTLYGGPLAICQVWNLKQQLKVGVRYFDLHAGIWLPTQKNVYIRDSHWMFWQHTELDNVLRDILDFLRDHKSETVILKVTLHGLYKKKVAQLTKELIDNFRNKIWTKTMTPYMKDARGNIVFLQTDVFHAGTENHDSRFFERNRLKDVEERLKQINSHICEHHIVVTETSTSLFNSPKRLARNVNEQLYDFVDWHKKTSKNHGCLGVISMNFPSAQLIKNIIQLKPCECGQGPEGGGRGKVQQKPFGPKINTEIPSSEQQTTSSPVTQTQPEPVAKPTNVPAPRGAPKSTATLERVTEPSTESESIDTSEPVIEPTTTSEMTAEAEPVTEPSTPSESMVTSEPVTELSTPSESMVTSKPVPEPSTPSESLITSEAVTEPSTPSESVVTPEAVTEPSSPSESVVTSEPVTEPPSPSESMVTSESVTEPPTASESLITSEAVTEPSTPSESVVTSEAVNEPSTASESMVTSEPVTEPPTPSESMVTSEPVTGPSNPTESVVTSEPVPESSTPSESVVSSEAV
ncbi:unnamed protein product, partial [Oreochromis niloticus]